MKKIIIAFTVIVASLVLVWLNWPTPVFTVTFFNIGQGDSALIRTPAKQTILIDGGPERTILTKLGQYLPWGERTIDLAILSHPHADHVAGLNYVLERYRVRQLVLTGAVHTTPEYLRFLELIKTKKIPVTFAQAGQVFALAEGVRVEILWPREILAGARVTDLNATSIVNRVVYEESAILFTGDTPQENEAALLAAGADLSANILKVAHQGSRTSSSQEFISAVAPEVAVIPVGENRYGHPHREVVERLKELVPQVLRTDEVGDITFISDGQAFTRRQKSWLLAF